MFETFDIWRLLAGLGIFLYGIFMIEESLRLLAGRAFKSLIRRFTKTPVRGIMAGTVSTAILQSSSAVSLMVLAFVGAGIMSLANAIAVLMGAKIGTTMTAWIVAVFGFKFEIEAFALPMIGIGGLGLILLAKNQRYVNISKFLVAFGFLFLGLDFMKSSVEELAATFDLAQLAGYGLWMWLLAGLLLTAVMQSSSATIAIVLTLIFTNVIGFSAGATMVIGANVGTTITVMIGSIGGLPSKKQAALSQLIFVVSTAVVAFLLLPVLVWLILDIFDFSDNLLIGLALFHTIFNVLGVALFYPFIPRLDDLVQKLIKEPVIDMTKYIKYTDPEIPEAAIVAIRKEVMRQLDLAMKMITRIYDIPTDEQRRQQSIGIIYSQLERLHAEIFEYYAKMLAFELEEEEAGKLERFVRSSRSIMNATKNLFELHLQVNDLKREDSKFMQSAYNRIEERIRKLDDVVIQALKSGMTEGDEELLNSAYFTVEEDDKIFIHSCARAISSEEVEEEDITRLLMMNRLITQALRMVVLSMQGLIVSKQESEEQLSNRAIE